jgi:hypothetical protein
MKRQFPHVLRRVLVAIALPCLGAAPLSALTVTNRSTGPHLQPPVPNPPAQSSQAPVFLHDIKDPVSIQTLGAWIGRIAAVLILGWLLWWAWNRWRKNRPQPVAPPPPPPDARARIRLQEALQWIDQPERFCTVVSEILRTYLEERFGLRAPERTTEEFLAELQTSGSLDLRHKQVLADFLTRCDLVKFAQANPGRPELEELHGVALRVVTETIPTAAPPVIPGPNPPQPPVLPTERTP